MFRFLEFVSEIIGWLAIAVSPTIIGCVTGSVIYLSLPDISGMILSITVALTGFTIGAIWATRIFRKTGTVQFLSRIISTPDIDQTGKSKTIPPSSTESSNMDDIKP